MTSYSNSKQENLYFYTEIWTLPLSTVLGFVCTLIDLLGGFLPPNCNATVLLSGSAFFKENKLHSMQMLQCTVLHIVQDRQNIKHFFYARDPCISSKLVLDSVAILTWKSSKFAKLWILIMVALTKLLDSLKFNFYNYLCTLHFKLLLYFVPPHNKRHFLALWVLQKKIKTITIRKGIHK